jgi:hypothetical protein
MKRILYYILGLVLLFSPTGCTDSLESVNKNPNDPEEVPVYSLFQYATISLVNDLSDEWFSGRQSLLYAQYFAQRNYSDEDRYMLRQNTNDSYWKYLYRHIANLEEVIKINNDPEMVINAALYGNNANQIAAAKILKSWAVQIMTDTWGDIPYSEAWKASEGIYNAAYDKQEDIYKDLLTVLKEAAATLKANESEPVLTRGDILYKGDATKWRKFANSLRMRVALRASKVLPEYKSIIEECIADGVFTSNSDNALFAYDAAPPTQNPFYKSLNVDGRNDFSLTKTIVDLTLGKDDELNNKVNPFKGFEDPRLKIWAKPNGAGQYVGMPYGMVASLSGAYINIGDPINFLASPTVIVSADFKMPVMDYAEVLFIQSEVKDFDDALYRKAVEASLIQWGVDAVEATAYAGSIPAANAERVLTQKWLASFMNGHNGWSEYRRTGYPSFLLLPGEISAEFYTKNDDDEDELQTVIFTTLGNTMNKIPTRVTYPQVEATVNAVSYKAAGLAIGGDYMYTRLWWQGVN